MQFRECLMDHLISKFVLHIKELYDNDEISNYDYITLIKTSEITKGLNISIREEDYLVNNISKKLSDLYSLELIRTAPMEFELNNE